MTALLASYGSLLDLVLVNSLLALSQHVVLRAGVFSLGSAGFAALGAYSSVLLAARLGLPAGVAIAAAVVVGAAAAAALTFPLSRLRGVFQAFASLAFVQIVLSTTLNAVDLTKGAEGINSIPRLVGTTELLLAVALVVWFLRTIGSFSLGRAFDVIREDETVAVSLGISVFKHHLVALTLSGAIAALAGALHAYSSYSITPNEFGFAMLVNVLAMVVLGGRASVWGALVGATILTGLPELFRWFADYRMVVQGALLMFTIIYLPSGVTDSLIGKFRDRRVSRAAALMRAEEATG